MTSSRRAFLLIVLGACAGPPKVAQTTRPGGPPDELRVEGLDQHRENPRFLADRIYVFGRSETRIAYLIEPATEACRCYRPEMVVKDLLTGEVTWKDSYDSGELEDDTSQLRNLDDLWHARGADWARHLREQGIEREPGLALDTIPTGGTAVPRFELHTEQVGDTSPEGYEHLTSYRVDLVTDAGTSTIARSSSPETNLTGVELLGYLAARDDGPAAVLVLEVRRGWEGPPSVHRLQVVGADLHVGPR
jgi:hypothetical protein